MSIASSSADGLPRRGAGAAVEHLGQPVGVDVELVDGRALGAEGALVDGRVGIALDVEDGAILGVDHRVAADGAVGADAGVLLGLGDAQRPGAGLGRAEVDAEGSHGGHGTAGQAASKQPAPGKDGSVHRFLRTSSGNGPSPPQRSGAPASMREWQVGDAAVSAHRSTGRASVKTASVEMVDGVPSVASLRATAHADRSKTPALSTARYSSRNATAVPSAPIRKERPLRPAAFSPAGCQEKVSRS